MAASWPTSIPTDSTLYIAVNELQTNLSSGINNSVTTITINSTTSFPTVGLVLIDNEIIKYAGISGSNLTGCTRGFDGTSAASHSAAAIVSFAICAQHHNVTKDEIIALATYLSNNLGTGAQPLANGSRALASNGSGKIIESSVTSTELGYLSGVTSAIQTQLGTLTTNVALKAPLASPTFSGTITTPLTASRAVVTGASSELAASTTTAAELLGLHNNGVNAAGYILGTVVQSVQVTDATSVTTSGTTYTNTNTTASITPKSTTHKIRISVTGNGNSTAYSTSNSYFTIARGGSNLAAANGFTFMSGNTGTVVQLPVCIVYMDSPATTSSVTYTLQIKSDTAAKCSWNGSSGTCVILLEEIAF